MSENPPPVFLLTEEQLASIVRAVQVPEDVRSRAEPDRDTPNDNSNRTQLTVRQPKGPCLKNAAGNPHGVTTLYVTTRYGDANPLVDLAPNQKVVLHLSWRFGRSGGECDVDVTQGGVFTLVGAESINAVAEIVSPTDTTPLEFLVPVDVEVMVGRDGAVSPKACYGTGTTFELALNATETAKTKIPERAGHMMLLLSRPERASDVTLRFYGSGRADALLLYAMSAPTNGEIPIVAGARYFQLVIVAGAAFNATPVFDLWL